MPRCPVVLSQLELSILIALVRQPKRTVTNTPFFAQFFLRLILDNVIFPQVIFAITATITTTIIITNTTANAVLS